jgi:hypothetical protein
MSNCVYSRAHPSTLVHSRLLDIRWRPSAERARHSRALLGMTVEREGACARFEMAAVAAAATRSIVTTRNPSLPAASPNSAPPRRWGRRASAGCRQRPRQSIVACRIRAFLQLAGSSRNLLTASPVMPGGCLWVRWASCATASLMPNSRTTARHGALGCSFSACCHSVCPGVVSGLPGLACRAARAAAALKHAQALAKAPAATHAPASGLPRFARGSCALQCYL